MNQLNYIEFIKSFITFEFNKFKIPQGYHRVIPENNKLTISTTSDTYNYIKCTNLKRIQKMFPFYVSEDNISNNNIGLMLTINLNRVYDIKILLLNEYNNFYFQIMDNPDINYKKLYQQLKFHLIQNDLLDQELFEKLCINDDNYYTLLYNKNYEICIDINCDNIEFIKFMLQFSSININYGLLSEVIKRTNLGDLKVILNHIKLDDNYENYLLLKSIINVPNVDPKIVQLLLSRFITFKDYGIINELLNNWKGDDIEKEILDILLLDERFVKMDMIEYSIEYEKYNLFKYLLSLNYKLNINHKNKINNHKKIFFKFLNKDG